MATGDTPPRIPSRVHANEARRDPSRSATDGTILARPPQPGSSITKEHGREPGKDAQRIRPSTPGPFQPQIGAGPPCNCREQQIAQPTPEPGRVSAEGGCPHSP